MTAVLTLTGNVGRSELKYTPSGKAVLNLSVAVDRNRLRDGKWETVATDWHRVEVWEQKAEALAEALSVGDRVIVTGSLESRKYDKDGEERVAWDIKAKDVGIVPRAEKRASSSAPAHDPWAAQQPVASDEPPF